VPRRAPRAKSPRPKPGPPKNTVEEKEFPDGSWERIYHGDKVRDSSCVHALDETAARDRQRHEDAERVRVRMGSDAPGLLELKHAEMYEQKGMLRALGPIGFHGIGPGRRGCDGCKSVVGKQRYVMGHGFLCGKCRERVEEESHGMARSAL
jgi:hypothetical protein